MRKIALTLMAVLAMTGVTSAVTIGYVQNADPGDGFRSFTVQATGIGINTLSQFTIDGDVNQIFGFMSTPSEWLADGSATGDALDSYVIFGQMRIADMPMHTGGVPGSKITLETITGGGQTGLGTLNNYDSGTPTWDGYLKLGAPTIVEETVDLLQLVIPDDGAVTVSLSLVTVEDDGSGDPYPFVLTTVHDFFDDDSLRIPMYGDTDYDGDVDLTDLTNFTSGWYGTQGEQTWETGDFDGDGDVDLTDLTSFTGGWYGPHGGGSGGEGFPVTIPEPSTLILLVLGGLCLVGYRLRK
jgi:hypothetical protein